ncbi:MAG: SRPBCC domain-containing protein [Streptosporangiaceae bacterium]
MSEPMNLSARVSAPIKDVHHALTDPGELRVWLAEHAEVDLPERFGFWGRTTPEGDAAHQRLLHTDDTTLHFAWLLDGVETTTEITLTEESADSTVISLSQSGFDLQELMAGTAGIRGVLQTFWCLSLANLVDHLEGRPLTPKADFTSTEFREEFLINAPMAEVYDSLTDSDKATTWFGYPIGIEPRLGGRFAMGGFDNPEPAQIVAFEEGRSMSIDFGPIGLTSWELEGSGGQTRLTFVQSGFDEPPYAGWAGWLSGLAELRRYHELPDWRPIWIAA